jgi:methyl-accepting chemotaxis protein
MLKILQTKLINLKLGQQISILMLLVFIGGIIFSGTSLFLILKQRAEIEITSQALMLMNAMQSVRNYTDNQVHPQLTEQLEKEFLPQSIPSYAVREVFEAFRGDRRYKDFFYKDATLNPTNLRDLADDFEKQIISEFRKNNETKEKSGFRKTTVGDLFYIARPFIVTKASCLKCHSNPAEAPKTMLERYGSKNGFGWPLNKVIGLQIIFVPASQVLQHALRSFLIIMGIIFLFFALVMFIVNWWLKQYVVKPIKQIEKVAEAVSIGDMTAQFERKSNDEVGNLATAFMRMKTSLDLAIKRLAKNRNSQSN